jgi:hypothetical protein
VISWEEASRCPKCTNAGDVTKSLPSKDDKGVRLTVHLIYCRNPLCTWADSSWMVSRYPDGSIMQPRGGRDKQFEMPGDKLVVAKNMEDVNAFAENMYEETMKPGREIGR